MRGSTCSSEPLAHRERSSVVRSRTPNFHPIHVRPGIEIYPVWSLDGTRIAFLSNRKSTAGTTFDIRDDVMTATEAIVRSMFPGVPVVPVMSTGATDGLYLRNAGIATFGVDGLFDDIDDVRAHGRDERVGVKQFNEDLEFQYRLITALSK